MSTLPANYRFTSRSDYKRYLKDAWTAAMRVAGDNLTSNEKAAIRDSTREAFEAKHGPVSAIKPFPSATAARASAPAPRLIPTPSPTPLPTLAVPLPVTEAPATAPAPVEVDLYTAPKRARVVVQCVGSCGRWITAKPGRPVAKNCGQHPKRKPRRDPDAASIVTRLNAAIAAAKE